MISDIRASAFVTACELYYSRQCTLSYRNLLPLIKGSLHYIDHEVSYLQLCRNFLFRLLFWGLTSCVFKLNRPEPRTLLQASAACWMTGTCPVNPQTVEFPSGRDRRMSVIRTWQSCYLLNVLLPKKNRGVNLTVIYIGRRLCLMQNKNERRHKHSCKQTLMLWSRNTFQTSGHTAKGNKNISKQRSQGALFTPVLKLKTNLSNPIQQSSLGVYGALFWRSRNKFRSRDQTSRRGGLQTWFIPVIELTPPFFRFA